jgi:uncharacterized protein (TIGR02646 family)
MRHLFRPGLDRVLSDYLDRMQDRIDSGIDIATAWKSQRKSSPMRRVVAVLARISGPRERCMYCEDSRGTDIEHFRPQSLYPGHVFRWLNFLWICAACNRSKGKRFPCDSFGEPLLLDPTLDEPWDHLFFDTATGEVTARWDAATGAESPKGTALLEIISSLRHQAVTEGRRRTYQRLHRAVRSFLAQSADGELAVPEEGVQDFLESVEDATDYGVAAWFFARDGQAEEPFRTLRLRCPSVWDRAVEQMKSCTTRF